MSSRTSFKRFEPRAAAAAVWLGAMLAAPSAHAETYRFEQGGYTDGASLVVTIEGPAGLIAKREWLGITRVDAVFTGNGKLSAFSLRSAADSAPAAIFDGLAHDLTLGDTKGDGIYIRVPGDQQLGVIAWFDPAGAQSSMTTTLMGNFVMPDGKPWSLRDTTLAPMRLTSAVPEPAAIAMMAVGLTGLLGLRRPQSRVG